MEKTFRNKRGRILKEADIEDYGAKECKWYGWAFEKFTSPQKKSVPDRIVTVPKRQTSWGSAFIFFIEFKRPGESATQLQQNDHARRREDGCVVFVVDSYEEFDIMVGIVKNILTTGVVEPIPYFLLT